MIVQFNVSAEFGDEHDELEESIITAIEAEMEDGSLPDKVFVPDDDDNEVEVNVSYNFALL